MHYPVNEFPDQLIENIGRGIACFVATNLGQLVNGDAGERLLSESLEVPYIKRHSLDDIRAEKTSWSVKVRYVENPATADGIELKLTTRFPKEAVASLEPHEIGRVYLQVWSDLVTETHARVSDLRTLILLMEKTHRTFALYEYRTHIWNSDQYVWKWSNEESKTTVHGYTLSGERVFAIHLNDSRLFVREKIGTRQVCRLTPCRQLTMDGIAELIGFTSASIVRLPREVEPEPELFGTPFLISEKKREKKPTYISTASLRLFEEAA